MGVGHHQYRSKKERKGLIVREVDRTDSVDQISGQYKIHDDHNNCSFLARKRKKEINIHDPGPPIQIQLPPFLLPSRFLPPLLGGNTWLGTW